MIISDWTFNVAKKRIFSVEKGKKMKLIEVTLKSCSSLNTTTAKMANPKSLKLIVEYQNVTQRIPDLFHIYAVIE